MTDRAHSEHLLAHLAWPDAKEAADAGRLVIVPTGAIEAHGPHLPLDVDTHQAEAVALRLAERISALVAPAIAYGYSTTFMAFSGTVTLSAETYQQVVFEVGASLIEGGFRRLLILNGNRPNGTCNDVAARRLSDAYKDEPGLQVTALSYWEPASAAIHKVRQSAVGGMGHACEFRNIASVGAQTGSRPPGSSRGGRITACRVGSGRGRHLGSFLRPASRSRGRSSGHFRRPDGCFR